MAAEIVPEDVNRWHFLGKAQIKTDRIDDARQSFDRALALPHKAMMDNNIAYDMADAGFDLDKSWHSISKALEATAPLVCEPKDLSDGDQCTAPLRQMAFMLDTAGWVLYRQGKTEDAEPYLRSSFAITPRSATELHTVIVLAKSGRLEEAVSLFAQARTRSDFGPGGFARDDARTGEGRGRRCRTPNAPRTRPGSAIGWVRPGQSVCTGGWKRKSDRSGSDYAGIPRLGRGGEISDTTGSIVAWLLHPFRPNNRVPA
jgi:hypothetical protein